MIDESVVHVQLVAFLLNINDDLSYDHACHYKYVAVYITPSVPVSIQTSKQYEISLGIIHVIEITSHIISILGC